MPPAIFGGGEKPLHVQLLAEHLGLIDVLENRLAAHLVESDQIKPLQHRGGFVEAELTGEIFAGMNVEGCDAKCRAGAGADCVAVKRCPGGGGRGGGAIGPEGEGGGPEGWGQPTEMKKKTGGGGVREIAE